MLENINTSDHMIQWVNHVPHSHARLYSSLYEVSATVMYYILTLFSTELRAQRRLMNLFSNKPKLKVGQIELLTWGCETSGAQPVSSNGVVSRSETGRIKKQVTAERVNEQLISSLSNYKKNKCSADDSFFFKIFM